MTSSAGPAHPTMRLHGWTATLTTAATLLLAGPAAAQLTGIVFHDRNRNGVRDAGEEGLARIVVSNQIDVTATTADGAFSLPGPGTGVAFVSVPDGYRASGPFWRSGIAAPPPAARGQQAAGAGSLDFGLVATPRLDSFTFVHASDPHVQRLTLGRLERALTIVDSGRPAFVLMSGDLVRDALRVPEAEAREYYALYVRTIAGTSAPVWNAPGNHELFGIERNLSNVSPDHPLYARAMYRQYLGPDYYSFNFGGVHFVALNTVDHDDMWYHGNVDSTQLAWLGRDLAAIPADMPVVTFNHIPLFSAAPAFDGYDDGLPAPTLIEVRGRTQFRHVVANAREVYRSVRSHPYPLALGGHNHMRELLEFDWDGSRTRFEQAAAIVGPRDAGPIVVPSGVTLYRVTNGVIGAGTFIPLDPPPARR